MAAVSYIRLAEAVERIGVSERTIRLMRRAGYLQTHTASGRMFFSLAEVERVAQFSLGSDAAMKRLGMSRPELHAWVDAGRIARISLATGRCYYHKGDVEKVRQELAGYLRSIKVTSTYGLPYEEIVRGVEKGCLRVVKLEQYTYVRCDDVVKAVSERGDYSTSEAAKVLGLTSKQLGNRGDKGDIHFTYSLTGRRRYTEGDVSYYASVLQQKKLAKDRKKR